MSEVFQKLYSTVQSRRENPAQGSYTAYLFDSGLDKILKKVGEECSETIIAAKNGNNIELVGEISDLIYHLIVLMVQSGVTLTSIEEELGKRAAVTGNLKEIKKTDKNT